MAKGFTLWFTGLPASGKSALANAAAEELRHSGFLVDLLDGDVIRTHLSKGLGFSKEDRDINIRRTGFVCHMISRHGGIAITAAISPYRAVRDENRKMIGNFIEVYCKCPLEVCERRDPKGLYKKARAALAAGKGMGFTGIDDPYEEPLNPEVLVETDKCSVQQGAKQILARLLELGYLAKGDTENGAGRAHHEYVPDELIAKAEAALRKAGRVHTGVLIEELHVGFATAAHLIDRLAENGVVAVKSP